MRKFGKFWVKDRCVVGGGNEMSMDDRCRGTGRTEDYAGFVG